MDWFIELFQATDSVAHIVLLYSIVIAVGVLLGLVLAVIVEFWIIVFYPLVFLYFKPMQDIPRYPEFSRHYESGTMYVVFKKNINYTDYHNNTTGEDSDGI